MSSMGAVAMLGRGPGLSMRLSVAGPVVGGSMLAAETHGVVLSGGSVDLQCRAWIPWRKGRLWPRNSQRMVLGRPFEAPLGSVRRSAAFGRQIPPQRRRSIVMVIGARCPTHTSASKRGELRQPLNRGKYARPFAVIGETVSHPVHSWVVYSWSAWVAASN